MIAEALAHAATLLADSGGSDDIEGILFVLAAGPVAAIGFYGATFRRYRNTDKSNQFEQETRVIAQPLQAFDTRVDHITGTRQTHIDGRNEGSYRQRVQRLPPRPPA